jgi:hypothetical protein
MKYSIERIIKNLYRNKFAYLFILINFMLGVGFFILCMNYRMTSLELLKESKREQAGELIRVNQWDISNERGKSIIYPISYDTYLELNADAKDSKDFAVLYSMEFILRVYVFEPEQGFELYIYFMNDELFKELYGVERKKEVVYLGVDAYQSLIQINELRNSTDKVNLIYIGPESYIDGDVLIMNQEKYSYEIIAPIETNTIMPGFTGDSGYDMKEAVIFPIESVFTPETSIPDLKLNLRCTLFFRYLTSNWKEDLVAQQLRKINHANKTISFVVEDEYMELKRVLDDYSYDMDRWLMVSLKHYVAFWYWLHRNDVSYVRKKVSFLAVSIAFGSTLKRLIIETMVELFLILFLGASLGISLLPVFKNFILYKDELRLNIWGIISVFLIALYI